MELVGVVARNLWFCRNVVVYGKPNSPYNTVVSNASNSLTSFKDANFQKLAGTVGKNGELRWKVHMDGFVKVNWDAAVENTKKKMGIGVIIRDSKGEVAKAMAALMAENFSRKLGFYKVILGGDALQIVQALGKEGSNWCIYGHLIEETREVLLSMQSWKVHHVRRNLNGAAHRLANVALSLSEAHVCFEETPHCISDITLFFLTCPYKRGEG
ncbi:uncharacterized protein LOC133872984 [Alnus glutinosa]|uniref:uncharacterized protein LOC133872984 n=1 Tax=Alnus glutinosa TaxID=3517 RepID=UPI002D785D9E|nr:uncharacterized protein LOC133872984 [Alnus glutinosa]